MGQSLGETEVEASPSVQARPASEVLKAPGPEARALVERVTSLTVALKKLVRQAEDDLLTYLDGERMEGGRSSPAFSRLPIQDRHHRHKESAATVSNADAIIALETAPQTARLWKYYRERVIEVHAEAKAGGPAFREGSAYEATRIAAALKVGGRDFSDTLQGFVSGPNSGDINRIWPQLVVNNILEHQGFAVDIGVMRPKPHACVNYWAVRALLAYEDDIRAVGVRLSRAIDTALRFAKQELAEGQRALLEHPDGFDATSYGFALATVLLAPPWLAEIEKKDARSEQLKALLRAQRSDGTWHTARPLYVRSPRERIFSGPEDLCFAIFDGLGKRSETPLLDPDDLLSEAMLLAGERFVDWAERTRFQPEVRLRTAGEPVLGVGWGSSAEPDAAGPECWATAIVLRAAKALLGALEEGAAQAAQRALAARPGPKPPAHPRWEDRIINHEVRKQLESERVRSALLAGPPGTGKTSLIEALAEHRASGKRSYLVNLSPDWLMVDGVHGVSSRLDFAFLLLELMKDTIVFFDEIDELLLEREGVADESFSRLLTTSMLPAFQRLHDGGRGIRFFVATNHVEKFDSAIIRKGRFDRVIPVELPDDESRERLLVTALQDAILASGGVEGLFRHCDALVREVLGPAVPGREEWKDAAKCLFRYQGAHEAIAQAMRLLVADATCARRNATYKLFHLAHLLQKVSEELSGDAEQPNREAPRPTRSEAREATEELHARIQKTHRRIALVEDATYHHLRALLIAAAAAQGLRAATEKAPVAFFVRDLHAVLTCVEAAWRPASSDVQRAHQLRAAETLTETLKVVRAKLEEALGSNAAESRRRAGARCLEVCARLLETGSERFAAFFEGRKQIEFFRTPTERHHAQMLTRRAPTKEGTVDAPPIAKADADYLDSAEWKKLRDAACRVDNERASLKDSLERLQNALKEADASSAEQEQALARETLKVLDDLKMGLPGRDARLPSNKELEVLSSAVVRLREIEASRSLEVRQRVEALEGALSKVAAGICRYFGSVVVPLAEEAMVHAEALARETNELKDLRSAEMLSIEEPRNAKDLANDANDAYAAYGNWREALAATQEFVKLRQKEGCIFGVATIGRPPYPVQVKNVPRLRAEVEPTAGRSAKCPAQEAMEALRSLNAAKRANALKDGHKELTVVSANRWELPLQEGVWRATELADIVSQEAKRLLHEPWGSTDDVPARKVPYGLPRAGEALLVGENFEREQFTEVAKKAAATFNLANADEFQKLLAMPRDQAARLVRDALHAACVQEARNSKYYIEAEDYEWKRKQLFDDKAGSGKPHPRQRTAFLSEEELKALRDEHPYLWALRVDAKF